jgi:tetratricopeptide (TPR) repeat protein
MGTKKYWNLITALSLYLVVVLLAFYCSAQTKAANPTEQNGRIVDSIEIAGNVNVSIEKILSVVRSKAGQVFNAAKANEDAKRIACIEGVDYVWYTTQPVDDKIKLTFVIVEKPKNLSSDSNSNKEKTQINKKDERVVTADAKTYLKIGIDSVDSGEYQKAIETLRECISIEPNNAEAHYNLGRAYGNLQKLKEAEEAFNKAISINKNYDRISK